MAKKEKNRQKQILKKAQKQKKRQENFKKQTLADKLKSLPNTEDMVNQALALIEAGKLREGEKILEKLARKESNDPHVNYGFGALASFKNDYDEAIDYYEQAIQIKPDLLEAHFNMAVTYEKQLNLKGMISAYRNVVKIGEPGNDFVKKAQERLDDFEQNVQINNGISTDELLEGNRIFDQGFVCLQSGKWEEGIENFKKAITINPKSSQSYGNMAICYVNLNKKQLAMDAFDAALAIDPNYKSPLIDRARIEEME